MRLYIRKRLYAGYRLIDDADDARLSRSISSNFGESSLSKCAPQPTIA